jgi:formylglycine-generating enzyme required for sulfatase activity/energy-coupling factor transporter ATP-binding protein EcfA2
MNGLTTDSRTAAQTRPELFVAYAESDSEWVHGFLLPELGLDPQSVMTPRDFRPGAALVQELERAVETARFTVLVLSPAFGMSQWSAFAELLATHDTLRRNSDRLVPVLLEADGQLPLRLDFRVRLDCTVQSRWEPEVARLRQLLQRGPPPAEHLICPYPGLLAFGPEDAGLFFGRDQESDDISRRLQQQNFLLVVGPSGSGKSSLVSAGVLPRLTAADRDRWLIRTLRPDTRALQWLAGTLGDGPGLPASADGLRESVDTLLATVPGAKRLMLLVDHAEAIFLLPSKRERTLFLTLLDGLRRVERCAVVLAMRADFYADLMTSILWPVSRGERVEIAPLRSTALREAITRPAASVGVQIEGVLVERLLHDAGEEPGALSLLQETMVLLWERRTRRLLTVSAYEDLGGPGRSGLAAALATRADAALAALSPDQRTIARRIFLRLVQLGEGRQDTRRPQAVAELRAAGEDPGLFASTLRHLTDRRLVAISGAGDEQPTVDLGHEAMIAHWPTLRDWIDESRASEMARRRIERDADEWQRNGHDAAELYRRHKLADALEFAARREHELSQKATRFLAVARRRRLLGRIGLGMAAATVLAGIVWLAKTPVREAWLRHEAEGLSPAVRLAGGPALVGSGNRRVRFPSLLVDVHEVSNQQYRYCVQALRCAPPDEPADDARFANGDRRLSVVWVTAYDAEQFCTWLGRRLPTEPEWERIARGTDGARYPWGNAPPAPGQVNASVGGRKPGPLMPVDSPAFRNGNSRDGIEQLIGNAQEWTATRARYGADNKRVVLLGNWNGRDRVQDLAVIGDSYLDSPVSVVSSVIVNDPSAPDATIGFRCVATTN